ncbi:N-acetylmuramoyl-L-alanine amidase [Nitrosomonas communis]|uniref:N-acetylmuramoyl-L-alanine amidase n=1 Tax=Nitrosomonas communis TaxID=44574 RepID=A0A1I4U4R5_9PROT|nr:N-acetylmuramoyl-L-alanine amidase [Nitrosomonas communis]SFM83821.1 N-acetylmuramoyl-L-alanine amidase [Nitrosomonas communis]
MTRQIKSIIIHCSNTLNGDHVSVEEIDAWHRKRGFYRSTDFRQRQNPNLTSIGYHFVIYPNGAVATGRHFDEVGEHAHDYNTKSIGICLIGTDKFTHEQWKSLEKCVCGLTTDIVLLQGGKESETPRVLGHRDLPEMHKKCPGFLVVDWLKNEMRPLPSHILDESEIEDAK